jgi:hypothetical protein
MPENQTAFARKGSGRILRSHRRWITTALMARAAIRSARLAPLPRPDPIMPLRAKNYVGDVCLVALRR